MTWRHRHYHRFDCCGHPGEEGGRGCLLLHTRPHIRMTKTRKSIVEIKVWRISNGAVSISMRTTSRKIYANKSKRETTPLIWPVKEGGRSSVCFFSQMCFFCLSRPLSFVKTNRFPSDVPNLQNLQPHVNSIERATQSITCQWSHLSTQMQWEEGRTAERLREELHSARGKDGQLGCKTGRKRQGQADDF
jgi:hypothetical protein